MAAFVLRGTPAGQMEFFPSLLTQGEGGVALPPCHWAEWDSTAAWLEISAAAGCCVCQRPVSCSWSLQTHWRPSDVLSAFLFWMALTLPPSFFFHRSVVHFSPSLPPAPCLRSQLSSVTLSSETQSPGLTRLLGVAFPGEKDKQEWESEQAEARRRDHRRIGTVSASCEGFVLFVLFGRGCQLANRHCLKMSGVGPPALSVHRVHSEQLCSAADHFHRWVGGWGGGGGEIPTPLSPFAAILAEAWHPKSQLKLTLCQCCPSVAAKQKYASGSQQKMQKLPSSG